MSSIEQSCYRMKEKLWAEGHHWWCNGLWEGFRGLVCRDLKPRHQCISVIGIKRREYTDLFIEVLETKTCLGYFDIMQVSFRSPYQSWCQFPKENSNKTDQIRSREYTYKWRFPKLDLHILGKRQDKDGMVAACLWFRTLNKGGTFVWYLKLSTQMRLVIIVSGWDANGMNYGKCS